MTVPEKKQMNAGVELLLERMKTHPEEFYVENQLRMGSTKWSNLWHMYQDYLSEEDKQAYIDGVKAINQQRFTEHILEGLVDPKQSSGAENPYISPYLKNIASGGATPARSSVTLNNTNAVYSNATATLSASGNLTTNSLTLGQTTVDETALHQLLHMKAQMELERQKQKQHQTLFGKLKNYLHNEGESK